MTSPFPRLRRVLPPRASGYAKASPDQTLNPSKLQRRRIVGEEDLGRASGCYHKFEPCRARLAVCSCWNDREAVRRACCGQCCS
jgi:hypothetical protein